MADAAPDIDEVVFALTPATHVVGLLNFSKTEHHKIYKSGIKAVDTTYDCEPDGLFQFLREIRDRSNQMGWMEGILNIDLSDDDEEDEEISNLITNYGTITLEQVARWERRYIATPSRAAQDTYMLYQCLMSSLAPAAKKKIMIWADQYTIEVNGSTYDSGVALLKVIIRESHLDTNATTNSIRTKLSNLDMYIATVNSDIGLFNQYVKMLIQSLTARNQGTSDLLINLFKGYSAVSDETFRAWLGRKQDDHEEGEELTPDALMLAAKISMTQWWRRALGTPRPTKKRLWPLRPNSHRRLKTSSAYNSRRQRNQTPRIETRPSQRSPEATIRRRGPFPRPAKRRLPNTKDTIGIGAARILEVFARSGAPTTPNPARVVRSLLTETNARRKARKRRNPSGSRRNLRLPAPMLPNSRRERPKTSRKMRANDWLDGPLA